VRRRANRWRISRYRRTIARFHPRSRRGFLSTLPSCTCAWLNAFAKEWSLSPDFDAAVKRHQLLDAIQKASVTGIRQKTRKTGNDTLGGELQTRFSQASSPRQTKLATLLVTNRALLESRNSIQHPLMSAAAAAAAAAASGSVQTPNRKCPGINAEPLLLRLPEYSRLSHSVCRY